MALTAGIALGGLLSGCATAPEPPPPAPVQVEQPRPVVQPAPRAPERYVVKAGDTLWDIASMFLRDPWLWPEIWYVNPQIANPHLIYPGDIITLFWYDGRPQLRIEREGEIYQTTLPIERLSPTVRTTPLAQAIPTIPIEEIGPFLSYPRVIDEDDYEDMPYVLRSMDGRLLSGDNESVYVRGIEPGDALRWHIIRLGDEYEDPVTGDTLGHEAIEVGQGVIRRHGDPATMFLEVTLREVMSGDRLVAVEDIEYNTDFVPIVPDHDIDGQIIDVVDGVSQIGQFQLVTINRGSDAGLEVGHVLGIYQRGAKISDPVNRGLFGDNVRLPDERAGTLLVFRVFDEVSYGLVVRATSEIHVLDMVSNP